ncbi:MAG: hypothetical protein R6U50_16600 [Desulfobacterales bacterium]
MNRKYGVLIIYFLYAMASVTPAPAEQGVPEGYRLLTAPAVTGGHLIAARYGTGAATDLLLKSFKEVGGFFTKGPVAVAGFKDAEDRRSEVIFRAKINGAPVVGVAYAIVADNAGKSGFIFDSPQTIRASLPQLIQLSGNGQSVSAPSALNWRETPFPDGSGSMRIPDGWGITFAQKGMASAQGPHGLIERGIWTPVYTRAAAAQFSSLGGLPIPGPVFDPTDPVTALNEYFAYVNTMNQQQGTAGRNILRLIEAVPAPVVPGYTQAAYIDYEYEMSHQRYRCIQYIMLGNVGVDGSWILYTTYVASPSETFSQNLPILLEIWGSSRTARHVIQERIENAIQNLKEAGEIYRQATGNQVKTQERIHDKWTEVIRGTRIVEDSLTGEWGSANLAWSKEIVQNLNASEGYERFREIPLWQFNQ